MIDAQRLGQLDGVLQHLATVAPKSLYAFWSGCKTAGFSGDQATAMTTTMLQTVLAIPSTSEQVATK